MTLETDRNHSLMAPDKDQNHTAKLSTGKNHSTVTSMGSNGAENNSAIISLGSNREKNHSKVVGGNKNGLKSLGDSMQGSRMKSQSSTGTGSSSASSGSCKFQFFVQSDDGLNLSVDLNSDPLDWMRACSDGIRVPQHLHKPEKPTLRNNSSFSSVVCNEERPQGMQVMPLRQLRAMGEAEAFQNIVLHEENGFEGRELTANGLEYSGFGVVSETRDPGISDQDALDACNQCDHAEEAIQNKDGEISRLERNFQMDIPVESTPQEMDCNHSTVDNLQDKSQMHKDEIKKVPVAKNLRNLKHLARGPFVVQVQDDNPKSRRKSSRFLPKGPY